MKLRFQIALFVAAMAPLPFVIASEFWLSWATLALFYAFLGQAWNILAGYGGQFSFGHALFFGCGAYATAMLQIHLGLNAWLGFVLGAAAAALVGAAMGFLVFRYGLRGSYFALVTLAFAEAFRIIVNSMGITGGGVGLLVKLQPGALNMQFTEKAGVFWLMLALVAVALAITAWLERSRFGARLIAVRENEDAARAIGVNAFRSKLSALTLSGALTGAAGAVYVQMFSYIDPGLAFGPGKSVEALLAPIIGGLGTVFGPILGAFALHGIAEVGKFGFGKAPGLDQVLYGVLLVLMVTFMPNGLFGLGRVSVRRLLGLRRA